MNSVTLEQLQELLGVQSQEMNKRFDTIDTRLDGMDDKFSQIDTRFDELARQIAIGFEDIEDRLDVRERVTRLENDFTKLKQALNI